MSDSKRCCTCTEIKPIYDFNRNKSNHDGVSNQCRECANEAWRKSTGYTGERYKGLVYCIPHPVYPEWFKIGASNNMKNRLNALNAATPFRDYTCIYQIESNDRIITESKIHDRLVKLGVEKRYEWFYTTLETIKQVMDEVKNEEASIRHRDEHSPQYDMVLSHSGC